MQNHKQPQPPATTGDTDTPGLPLAAHILLAVIISAIGWALFALITDPVAGVGLLGVAWALTAATELVLRKRGGRS
jgi:hypothetical protein